MTEDKNFSVNVLRTYVQDAHLSILIGAGSSAGYFAVLGGVEDALAGIEQSSANEAQKEFARASALAYFFTTVLEPNHKLIVGDSAAKETIDGYRALGRGLSRILLTRKSTLLDPRACIYTTNVDLMFEVGFDLERIPFNDGFSGRFTRILDTGSFGNLQLRTSTRYDRQSAMPAIDLVKLHGSVDWIDTGGRVQSDQRLALLTDIRGLLDPLASKLTTFTSNQVTASLALKSGAEADDDVRALLAAFDRLAVVLPEKAKFASTLLAQHLLRVAPAPRQRARARELASCWSTASPSATSTSVISSSARPGPIRRFRWSIFCYTEDAANDIAMLSRNRIFRTRTSTLRRGRRARPHRVHRRMARPAGFAGGPAKAPVPRDGRRNRAGARSRRGFPRGPSQPRQRPASPGSRRQGEEQLAPLLPGRLVRNVSVGSYVKITKGFSELVGQVDGESDRRGPHCSSPTTGAHQTACSDARDQPRWVHPARTLRAWRPGTAAARQRVLRPAQP